LKGLEVYSLSNFPWRWHFWCGSIPEWTLLEPH